jgi:hypothetical protein
MTLKSTPSAVEQIANAVLYEGYLLYPYRHSAVKNRQRFNFGLVYPRLFSDAQGAGNPWFVETQCLVVGGPLTCLQVEVRFLRLIERVCEEDAGGLPSAVQEAAECEVAIPAFPLADLLAAPAEHSFSWSEKEETAEGTQRRQMRIQGTVRVKVMESDGEVWRVSVRIKNTSPYASPVSGHRSEHCSEQGEAVLLQTLASTHAILRTKEGRFISLIDPPEGLRAAAAACTNTGLWPVLAGDEERQDTLLASPIILYDYPQIAPESPGDLFDGTEIDEILTLRILTLTDAEKDEVRRADGRAKEMLERTEQLGAEHLMKLHGVLREAKSGRKETA